MYPFGISTSQSLQSTTCLARAPQIRTLHCNTQSKFSWQRPDQLVQQALRVLRRCVLMCCSETGLRSVIVASHPTRRERSKRRHRAQRKKVKPRICESTDEYLKAVSSCTLTRVFLQGQDGSPDRPRLAVYKSNNHIYGQVTLQKLLTPI